MVRTFKTEADFTRWFCNCIEKIGGFCFALVGGVRQASGLPDRYISHPQWQGFIEFKKDSNKVKKGGLQDIMLRRLRKTGTSACIVTYDSRKHEVQFYTEKDSKLCVPLQEKTDVEYAKLFIFTLRKLQLGVTETRQN